MTARKYFGKVLENGQLSLPDDLKKNIGSVFEVILVPIEEPDIFEYTQFLRNEKHIESMSVQEVAHVIHESRGIDASSSN